MVLSEITNLRRQLCLYQTEFAPHYLAEYHHSLFRVNYSISVCILYALIFMYLQTRYVLKVPSPASGMHSRKTCLGKPGGFAENDCDHLWCSQRLGQVSLWEIRRGLLLWTVSSVACFCKKSSPTFTFSHSNIVHELLCCCLRPPSCCN